MLNDNIKIIRKNKGYTQEELAIRLNVTRQTLSKWERGASVPDALLLSKMADILEVGVTDLLGDELPDIEEKNAIAEQLSRINEQLIVRNKRFNSIINALIIALVLVLAIIVVNFNKFGFIKTNEDHIGMLSYRLPGGNYIHDKGDVGITIDLDGRERITAKTYKEKNDDTKISIWEYDDYDESIIDEFKKENESTLASFSEEYGSVPEVVDEIIVATDCQINNEIPETGMFYLALVCIDDKTYKIKAIGGNDPRAEAESLIASIEIDPTLEYEYR